MPKLCEVEAELANVERLWALVFGDTPMRKGAVIATAQKQGMVSRHLV